MTQCDDAGADRHEPRDQRRHDRSLAPRIQPREHNHRRRKNDGDDLEPDPRLEAERKPGSRDQRKTRRVHDVIGQRRIENVAVAALQYRPRDAEVDRVVSSWMRNGLERQEREDEMDDREDRRYAITRETIVLSHRHGKTITFARDSTRETASA